MTTSAVQLRVLELYQEVDREVRAAGPVCLASGRCCRFKEWGHVLYLSSLEADLLLGDKSVADVSGSDGLTSYSPGLGRGVEAPRPGPGLNEQTTPEHLAGESCPYQKDNLCTAREPRPLACRIYYCDPHYQQTASELTEKYLRRLKDLAEEHGLEWKYAPLHQFLKESGGSA